MSLIVPTFNERENIAPLVERVERALAGVPHEMVFVDDSTDGTSAAITEQARRHPHITLVQRQGRRGLASAVVEGIERASGEILCVLDADLQHPPEALPMLVEALQRTDADLVVGSRYIPGGSYEAFTAMRRLASRVATLLARALLSRARLVSDPMSGFFVFRRRVVQDIPLRPLGYKILLEILVRGRVGRVTEVPYRFQAREAGRSKLTMRQNWQYLRHLLRLATVGAEASLRPAAPDGAHLAAEASAKRRAFVRYLNDGPLPGMRTIQGPEPNGRPQVSIIIPTADGARGGNLTRLLGEIEQQTLREFEVIVVQGDRRQGRAINTAAAIARGEILVTMDDDTQLGHPDLLEKIVGAFAADSSIGIAGVANLPPSDAPWVVRRAMREVPRRSSPLVGRVTESDMVEHPCLAIRRELFYRVGGEHELIPRGLDPYLRQEVRRAGFRVVVIPDAWIHHLLPPTLRGVLRQYFRNGVGAAYVRKFYPQWVIEQTEAHTEEVPVRTSLPRRGLRYARRLAGAVVSGRWIYLGTLIAYAVGYAWGSWTLREDSL